MGKLLSYQLKSHFKQNWFLVAMPILLVLANIFTETILSYSKAEIAAGFIMIGIIIVYAAAAITVIVSDYNRFYGKEALFYNSLPVSAGGVTAARFFNYLILWIIHSLILFANIVFFVMINLYLGKGNVGAEINLLFKEIVKYLSNYTPSQIMGAIILLVLFFTYSIGKVMFAISISGEKRFNRLDFGGAVLAYIIITAITNSIALPIIDRISTNYFDIEVLNATILNMPMVIIYSIISIIFILGTYYEHKIRISVS